MQSPTLQNRIFARILLSLKLFKKQLCRYCSFLCKCFLSPLPLPLGMAVLADTKKQDWSWSGLYLVSVLREHHWLELGFLQRGRDPTYHCQCHHVLTICFAALSKAQARGLIKVPGIEVYWESNCCSGHTHTCILPTPC